MADTSVFPYKHLAAFLFRSFDYMSNEKIRIQIVIMHVVGSGRNPVSNRMRWPAGPVELRSSQYRQTRLHENPAWQAGLDFNALDNSVVCVVELGHEPPNVIAEPEIG